MMAYAEEIEFDAKIIRILSYLRIFELPHKKASHLADTIYHKIYHKYDISQENFPFEIFVRLAHLSCAFY